MIEGLLIGHTTDDTAHTGCTALIFPEGTVASGEVRGGAPATRDFALLEASRTVDRIDAVCLSGGSVFGLAAVDGVVRWCEEHGRGLPTTAGRVPIVVGMSLFDLTGVDGRDPSVRPTAADGYAACVSAQAASDHPVGRVGAGTGATTGKHLWQRAPAPGGFGTAHRTERGLTVFAAVAANAYGSVVEDGGPMPTAGPRPDHPHPSPGAPFGNTTLGVVVTDVSLDKHACYLVAQSGHDGLARALDPAHTRFDGDAVVAAATGTVARTHERDLDLVRELATNVMADAVRVAADRRPQTQ
jgi:L-aminopeptidase/D-esterase-like protein